MLWLDIQAGMLLADFLHGRAQCSQVVDVRGICVQRASKGSRLETIGLVGCVEDVVKGRNLIQDGLVEVCCDVVAVGLEDRDGGTDDLDLLGC